VIVERVTRTRVHRRLDLPGTEARQARISLLRGATPLARVTRQLTGPTQRISLPRPAQRITSVAVLRGRSASPRARRPTSRPYA